MGKTLDLSGNVLQVDGVNYATVASNVHVIDLDSITLSADKSAIHVGSYSSPITLGDTTNLLVQFHAESAGNDEGGYDYCLFSSLKSGTGNDNMIGIHNTCHVVSGADPKTVQALQGHTYLEAGSNLATRGGDLTAGMFCAWLKQYSDVGATQDSGSLAANIWLDTQLNGTKSGTTYSIFSTTGVAVTAWAGFGTDAVGFADLFKFEADAPPVGAANLADTGSGVAKTLAVNIAGTQYYAVLYAAAS